ncbi:MAG: trypsin-like peptidase domain-containing protein [Flavobacteriales bacterium]|nr:trypsin-like peptidase domain-containing protein [Flavobacteriales bacterium]
MLRSIEPLIFCILSLQSAAQDAGVRVFAQASGAVAWVETISADSLHRLRSSGVVLKEQGWLLTTFHGYKYGDNITARLGEVPLRLGAVITADEARDLVVVQVLGTEPAAAWKSVPTLATVTSNAIPTGADGYAIGNPNGAELVISHGLVSGLRPFGRTGRKLPQFSAPISEGNSGGALVDSKARLIGLPMAWHADGGGQALNFALPMEEIFAAVAIPRNDMPVPDAAWLFATHAYRIGDCLRAQELFIGIIKNNSTHASDAAYYSARCMQRSGNAKGAQEIYERLVVIDPLDAKSLYRLGEVLLELGETQRAFELRQRAGRLNPDLLTNDQWDCCVTITPPPRLTAPWTSATARRPLPTSRNGWRTCSSWLRSIVVGCWRG